VDDDGCRIVDDEVLERIRALVIPPAWRRVWICERPNGHIQAVGVDVAGRRQYLYHERWRLERDEEKFDRVLEMATSLPAVRAHVASDLTASGIGRRRVEAIAISLLDRGIFRVGGEEYAEANGTRGVATLLRTQVSVSGDEVTFDFIAKGSLRRRVRVIDSALARGVRSLQRSRARSDRLFVYREGLEYRELHAEDINMRIAELSECYCTAKDLRTWQATVVAAAALAAADRPHSQRGRKRVEKQVMEEVADTLGNTATIARNSYVDPRVVRAYEDGTTIERALRRADRMQTEDEQRTCIEKAVIRLLRNN
jgi:DNA topoisomerase IB